MSGLKHIPTWMERRHPDEPPDFEHWIACAEEEIADLRADRERLHAELVAMTAERDTLKADAKRYHALRNNHWSDGPETLIVTRAKFVKFGCDTFTHERLDEAINLEDI